MIVVSDTSPILNLAAVDRVHLLRDLYDEIVISPAVEVELSRNAIKTDQSWLRLVAPGDHREVARSDSNSILVRRKP